MTMPYLFSAEGETKLAATLAQRPLLAFDFDGTLAPVVARPGDARTSRAVSTRLGALGARLPPAILTPRSVADVRTRLDFEPTFAVGNHGAEDERAVDGTMPPTPALDRLRELLVRRRDGLAAAGVAVEDKQLSIALHYRLSRGCERALALIELLTPLAGALRVFAGKLVVNLSAPDAPDKFDAVQALLARCGADRAVFAGDDVNDEPVFARAPASWLTVRVGRDDPSSKASFFLDELREMAMLLERMPVLLPANPR